MALSILRNSLLFTVCFAVDLMFKLIMAVMKQIKQ
jgi:hypothetical protein